MLSLLPLVALCAWFGAQDHNGQDHKVKSSTVDVVEMKARRNDDVIEVALQVKNSAEKQLKNVQIIFLFESSAGDPVSTEEMKIDEPRLMPGAESSLNVQLKDSPRATQIRIGAKVGGAEVTVGDSGPYLIE